MTLATNISKTLLELTGEPRAEVAIYELMKDAVEHRIEKIETEMKKLEDKYRMTFKDFMEKFQKEEIPDSYGYNVESDYLEWEGLISRLNKYKSLLNSLI